MKTRLLFLVLLAVGSLGAQAQDPLTELFKSELKQQMEALQGKELPPYYMSYQVVDKHRQTISSSFGSISKTKNERFCRLVPQIRIGDMNMDNFAVVDMGTQGSRGGFPSAILPIDGENFETPVREAIRLDVNSRYQFALTCYNYAKTKKNVDVASTDKAAWFSKAPVEKYYEAPFSEERMTLEQEVWKKRLKEITAVFNDYSYLLVGSASLEYTVERRYFVNTDGTEVVQNLPYARLMIQAKTKAEDGMNLPLYLSYFAYEPKGLPENARVLADVKAIAEKLGELRTAPIVDPYSGPALLSGEASGVFFHEIFGHRVEGQRMKREWDGQTFKTMMGKYVLPASMQVYDDPTLRSYENQELNGFYQFDDQGVKAERVNVVKDGKLNDFLMTRVPIEGHLRSNGHARVDSDGKDPVSRQSNLVIETTDHKTEAELRALFVEELKKQEKEFGYFFKEVTGGFTFTAKGQINSFNVTPLEVYRVFTDGRPDQLVRGVDLIGTPLAMFSNILYAGGNAEVFTGMCGAESGWVPVTAISPTIFVSKIELQRKAKSNEILPILSDPTKN